MDQRTAGTIKHIVPNLRHRWPDELKRFSDTAIALVYQDFSLSDEFGENDKRFPEWFEMIEQKMNEL
jgi:hypothetical protein